MYIPKLLKLWIIQIIFLKPTFARNKNSFPSNFKFGVGVSSYQIEGGWNADGKGEDIWDRFVHTSPERITDNATGDIACDSYHKYNEDIQLVKQLGVDHYRFSLSWSRILPTGLISEINQAGVDYYRNMIRAMKKNNIEPFITLYHWDLPQKLQDAGGWPNSKLADYFADYARLAFKLFGDDVKLWATFNEPKQICFGGYSVNLLAPAVVLSGTADYLCVHTLIKAHAKAYHIYDKEFRWRQRGQITIVLDNQWVEPASDSREDKELANRLQQFWFGIFAQPIYHPEGNYPKIVRDRIANRSKLEGFAQSRLPTFTRSEIRYIRGTFDFMGVNSYTTCYAQKIDEYPIGAPGWLKDMGVSYYQDSSWEGSASSWLKVVPWGFRKVLNWVYRNYNYPQVFITENGYADYGELDDQNRTKYIKAYLNNTLLAINEDKVNVIGYTAWSLLDNFEWTAGYSIKYGFYYVDFNDPNRTRTAKKSASSYKKIVTSKHLE